MSFKVQSNGLIAVETTALTPDQALTFAQELATAAWQMQSVVHKNQTLRLVTERAAKAMRDIHDAVYVVGGNGAIR